MPTGEQRELLANSSGCKTDILALQLENYVFERMPVAVRTSFE